MFELTFIVNLAVTGSKKLYLNWEQMLFIIKLFGNYFSAKLLSY